MSRVSNMSAGFDWNAEQQAKVDAMHKSYERQRQQIRAAMKKTVPGTAVHLAHLESLGKVDAREREEDAAMPAPQDHYLFGTRADGSWLPTNATQAEGDACAREKKAKSLEGQYNSAIDNEQRSALERNDTEALDKMTDGTWEYGKGSNDDGTN